MNVVLAMGVGELLWARVRDFREDKGGEGRGVCGCGSARGVFGEDGGAVGDACAVK